jgi:hypothetical protein
LAGAFSNALHDHKARRVPGPAKLERAAAATGTDGEQKLQNNQTVPEAAWDK